MKDERKRYLIIRNVLIITLILNWSVSLAKIVYGLITKSISMTADGFHSLSDGTSNVICLIGIWFACRPVDKEHPYGHKKYETFTSLAIAALLFFISFNLLKEVIARFFKPVVPEVNVLSFVVMLATLMINIFVVFYERKKGKELKSDILITDSTHTKTDIYVSLSVIIALVSIKLGFNVIDLIAGIFISGLIAWAAIGIARESSYILCDGCTVDTKLIADVVKKVQGVKRCHKIRARGRQDDIHVDLHVSVDNNMHVDKAHYISHKIQDDVKRQIEGVTDVIVHVEPL